MVLPSPNKRPIIAIDPGKSGGFAWQEGHETKTLRMPETEGDIVSFLSRFNKFDVTPIIFLEEVGGYIGKAQPASSAFTFGRNFGFLLGTLMAFGYAIELIKPQRWQKPLGLGTSGACESKTEWKNKLKAKAQQLFPGANITLATSDALLLLHYAYTHHASSSLPSSPCTENQSVSSET